MKKSFFVLGVAVAALASCTNEEVVDMPQSRAIQFGTFVNHSTRSVTETTEKSFTKFFVFGNYGEGTTWTPVYTNVEVKGGSVGESGTVWTPTQTAYWEANKKYNFGAYSNGNNKLETGVSFDAANQKLTFSNYTVGDNDLLVAIPNTKTSETEATSNEPVALSFYHMLSQVKFTFNNTDSHDYIMKISDIKVNAVKTCEGSATYAVNGAPSIEWKTQSVSTADYDFGTIDDIAEEPVSGDSHSTTCFVIPQPNTNLQVTFTATFSDKSEKEIAKNKFTGKLSYQGDKEGTEKDEWTPGFKYNYTVEINGSTINPDLEQQEIKFQVSIVDEWKDANETTVTPSKDEE